jgi:hypothetical protein
MTRPARRNHTPGFKAKVALVAIKGDKTLAELAQIFDVQPNEITGLAGIASRRGGRGIRVWRGRSRMRRRWILNGLHAKIGKLRWRTICRRTSFCPVRLAKPA